MLIEPWPSSFHLSLLYVVVPTLFAEKIPLVLHPSVVYRQSLKIA